MIRISVTVFWLFAWANSANAFQPITPVQADFFERRIRPVLAEHCFSCHGPKKQMFGLRLDSRKTLLDGSDEGAVIDLKHPEKSTLLHAIRHEGGRKMPPKGKLSPQAIADLTAWIKMGAPWPKSKDVAKTPAKSDDDWKRHWAFQQVRRPAPPKVKNRAWPKNAIDAFVLAQLEAKGLTPSPEADRRVLIRRATFDLLGLPPTPEEVRDFEADLSDTAYEKLIDRLLASPHYGERWGRHWLDVARYADTKGYVFFEQAEFPWAYTFREYVIRSFNEDKPYNQFVLEQLAADRLDLKDDRRSLQALGFLTLGGRFMNNQHDIIDDRIDVVTRGLLGLTVTCARCHDHKFDPVPSKDYYSLYGVFASCAEPTVAPLFEPAPKTDEYDKFAKELISKEAKLTDFVKAKHAALVDGSRKRVANYLVAAHALRDQPNTEDFMLIADGNDLNPTMIIRWQAYLARKAKSRDPVWTIWNTLAAVPEKDMAGWSAALTQLSGDKAKSSSPLLAQALKNAPPKTMVELAKIYATVLHDIDKKWRETSIKKGRMDDPSEEELRAVFYGPDAPPDVAMLPYGDLSLLPDRPSQATLQKLRGDLEKWRSSGPGAPPRAMVLEDRPTPGEPRVFLRGNPNNLGEVVPRQFLGALSRESRAPFKDGSGRLELARAVIDPANPLTARVMVNRIWLHHFGAGLVRTPSDFGLRGETPSHPELLDHLATVFVDNGWSIKKMHKLIMLSSTYRQRSFDREDCKAVDPENHLLWKMNRRRLDFESMRDAVLAVSGRLDRKVGGASVKNITSPSVTRRTMYGFLDRLNLPTVYRTFDFPNPDATSPGRDITTVPPQSLFMMNHPFIIENAKHLVRRKDIASEKENRAKIGRMFLLAYGRPSTKAEVDLALEYLGAMPNAAMWDRYAQALLLANEFVFVD